MTAWERRSTEVQMAVEKHLKSELRTDIEEKQDSTAEDGSVEDQETSQNSSR